jgi:hypothetical protein
MPGQGIAPVPGGLDQVRQRLVVVLLERRDDLQDQRDVGGAGGAERGQRPLGRDDPGGVGLR